MYGPQVHYIPPAGAPAQHNIPRSQYLLSKESIFVSMSVNAILLQLCKNLLDLKEASNNHYNRAPLFPRMSHDRKRESEESKFNYGGGRERKRMKEREGGEESNACFPTTCFIPPGPWNAQFHLGGLSIKDVVWMIGDILLFADTQCAELAE